MFSRLLFNLHEIYVTGISFFENGKEEKKIELNWQLKKE